MEHALDQGQLAILSALARAELRERRTSGINIAELEHLRDVLEIMEIEANSIPK